MTNSKSIIKNFLIIGCTHGDEQIGKYVFDTFAQGQNQNWKYRTMIGNPEAMMLNTRYIDTDLNRSFNKSSPLGYEENRANLITKQMLQSDFVIDIHQTTAIIADCIFVLDTYLDILQQCQYFDIKHIVVASGMTKTYFWKMLHQD